MTQGYVSVYHYTDVLYVQAMRRESFWLAGGPPYLRVADGDGAKAVGRTVREALDASNVPAPSSPSPFLEWSGASSMTMFSKRSRHVTVDLDGDRIVVSPWATDRKGDSEPLEDQQIELSAAASVEELGRTVLDALERSTVAPTR